MRLNPRAASIAATVALHTAAIGVLLQFDAVRKPLAEALPLMVDLVTLRKPEPPPPPPKVEPPRPRPVAKQPVPQVQAPEPPPVLVTEAAAPGPQRTAPPPRVEPVPVVVPTAPPPPPRPAPVQPPSFDAAYLKNPPPAYPANSKRRGEQGQVVLRVYVSAEGLAERVEIRTSSGHERLDRAAHDAVHQWRFVPARQGERTVAAWVLVPINFQLEN